MIAILGASLVVCVVMVIYPYVLYPAILRGLPARDVGRGQAGDLTMTLVFCAYNEGPALSEKLLNIERLKARYADLEVLAYNDASDDETLALLSGRPDLLTVIDGDGRHGKAHGMKILASRARGEILVFTDANVLLDEDALANLAEWYADPDVGGVCGRLLYLNAGETATASVGGTYWRLEERIKSLESRTGNVMGADGSIFSIRRELYPEFPDTVLDDLTVSMAVVFAGKRLIKADDVIAYERLVSASSDEFARKTRISARAFHTHQHLRPQLSHMSPLDKFKYRSRKVVRWFGGAFLVLGVVLALALAATISPWALLGTLIVLAGIYLIGRRATTGPIAVLKEIVLALMATLLGVTRALRGRTYSTWSPAKSR